MSGQQTPERLDGSPGLNRLDRRALVRDHPPASTNQEPPLQILNARMDVDAYFRALAGTAQRVLMLDYDGTLAPFHFDPAQARPYPGIVRSLDVIAAVPGTRLVIVSGRPAQELLPLLPLEQRPEIWGAHGWERLLPAGTLEIRVLAATARSALQEAELMGATALAMGARLERKPASLALHWRGLEPEVAQSIQQWARAAWSPLTREKDLAILPFEGGMELRARECSKSQAVSTVMAETAGDAMFAYLGDDITDEDAFGAVKAGGKRGLAVLVREELRETAADLWVCPPRQLLEFLERWQLPPG